MKKVIISIGLVTIIGLSCFLSYTMGVEDSHITSKNFDTTRIDSLSKVQMDLEKKVNILNNYLVIKHLEYIEVCELIKKPNLN
jgi:hypothetical protein